ncbi:MAG: Gfo/Idh/MocA family protein, partial [Planctomycetota bacterium]
MGSKQRGIGVVGLGNVAGAHIKAFGEVVGARVVAATSRREHTDDQLQETYGTTFKVYHELDDMLADPAVEVVDICTPHFLHTEQAIASARAGKHLVIEKPIGLGPDELRDLERTVEKAGVRVCVCFECRFSGHFSCVHSMIDRGLLGRLHYGEVDYHHTIRGHRKAWHNTIEGAGSSLLTAGCHALDGLLFFMDRPVTEVSSMTT